MKNVFFVYMTFLLTACSNSDYKQIAYYKNNDIHFRVFVYETSVTDLSQLKAHGESQMYTEGGTTAVYYYNKADIVADNVTLANNAFDAQTNACGENCIALYCKFPTGKESFIENPCK
ncbi:MAG: hypothetical protein MJZ33_14755 [Paludibacteraceae bacterium]|nr:hypothetical protein [Paludibacteraceae bacterium]